MKEEIKVLYLQEWVAKGHGVEQYVKERMSESMAGGNLCREGVSEGVRVDSTVCKCQKV